MGAPQGNQYAKSCETSGRPKEYDRIKIGQDFVKWATDNIDALTVPMFCVSIGLHSGIFRNWSRESDEFRVLFMEGKEQIGINRLRASQQSLLDNSIYRAHVGNYDNDINEYMREEKIFDSSLRKEEDSAESSMTIKVQHDGLGSGLDLLTTAIPNPPDYGSK